MSFTIVLIHGAWLSPASWSRFQGRFQQRGATVIAPAWPYMDHPVEILQRTPDPRLARLGIPEIVDHYAAIIQAMPTPPVLIGHSFGGLFVQLLLARGLGRAGVAIDPAAPFGIPVHPNALISSLPVFTRLGSWSQTLRMSRKDFATRFAQTLPKARIDAEYREQVVPTPGRIYWQSVLGIGSRIRFADPRRAPLLMISGAKDRTVPLPTVFANYRKQRKAAASLTDYKAFPKRSHYLCNEPRWEEVADFAFEWAERQVG